MSTTAWQEETGRPPSEHAADYGNLVNNLATFLHRFAGAHPDQSTIAELDADLRQWITVLAAAEMNEDEQLFGKFSAGHNRRQCLTPEFELLEGTPVSVRGAVTFGRYFLGSAAVHEGAIALLLDEVMGILASSAGPPGVRTASLTTDYRNLTPIDEPLDVHAWLASEVGRKRTISAEIRHGETLCV